VDCYPPFHATWFITFLTLPGQALNEGLEGRGGRGDILFPRYVDRFALLFLPTLGCSMHDEYFRNDHYPVVLRVQAELQVRRCFATVQSSRV
jgi:hypothetical protein